MSESTFEEECKRGFLYYCHAYETAFYHSEKRVYLEKAYSVIDTYLDWRDVQGL